jgi:hypothetical protein
MSEVMPESVPASLRMKIKPAFPLERLCLSWHDFHASKFGMRMFGMH